jgi:hypothetical protein
MRTFTLGSGTERKTVVIEVDGARMAVIDRRPDGSTRRNEKELKSAGDAQKASEQLARELVARGYVEQAGGARPNGKPAAPVPKDRPSPAALFDDDENAGEGEEAAPVLSRLAPRAAATAAATADEAAPKKKKKSGGKKKRKASAGGGDGLDKRVLAGSAAVGLLLVAGFGYLIYEVAFKPASIVGKWAGSRTEHEISRFVAHTTYGLILDEHGAAARAIEEHASGGTYTVKGDRLKLSLKDDEGETFEEEYKFELGSVTLDLYDPKSGKKIVQLIRQSGPAIIAGAGAAPKAAAPPKDVAADKVDPAADAKLASVTFSPKDGAFKMRHPAGWEVETGSRPDNTYSWGRFTKGSGKIQVYADVTGSLMSGSDSAHDVEEGSEFAPVHRAHELYKKTVAEQYSDYQESAPTVFKGAAMGEGRVASFTASAGGLFGGKLRGYRVTLLTNNRRITILCEAPEKEFEALRPTFLAVCRSLSY